uniref:Homologous recombination OB-fold protein OB-fold domain-containing protein n=1 Tax=Tanacetum cinerariifolium TaxID=118510 RepID=A0A6L2KA70_TANCI|nr:hypothetical protein [Tanacetum cinerariifolium]
MYNLGVISYCALSEQLDWNNLEVHHCPYDLIKALPMQMSSQGRQIIPTDFLFNNDLEYLRGGSNDKKYTASTIKSKATRYELKGIEDMVPNLWSPIKEGDFKRLHLNDIEDMLLLIVQKKLNNLDWNVIVHLEVSLRMFIRRNVIHARVEDLQLGVESYQKKLNLSKPRTQDVDMSRRPAYTTLLNPQHQIDTKVFTMTMEILPESTSNKLCNQEKYEHVGLKVTSTQDGKRSQDDDKRLCLADDLKEAHVHMQVKLKGTSSSLKSKDHCVNHKLKDKDSRPRAKTKVIRRMVGTSSSSFLSLVSSTRWKDCWSDCGWEALACKWGLEIRIVRHLVVWREEFCLVSGLKFSVENSIDYNKAKDPISFRHRVFSSDFDGIPIRGKDVLLLIESDVFKRLDDNDVVSLSNDRVSWDNYPWGSYVWPTLYKHLRDANVKRWQPLYASDPTNETETKSYSIEGFAWAFKTWILESFRAETDDYYTRYRRHPRIVAWSSKHKFYRNMLKPMLHRRGYQQIKEKNADMYEKMTRFMEDMRRVPEANRTPIIADQHFGGRYKMPPGRGADRIGVSLGSHRPTVILKLSCLVEKKRTKVRSLAVLFSVVNWDRSPSSDLSNLKVDSNLYQLSKMDASFNNENEAWEYSLDIDDFYLHLTPVVRSSNSTHVKPSPYTRNPVTIIPGPLGVVHVSSRTRVEPSRSNLNPVRIILGPASLVQQARLLKENIFILDPDGALMSTQQYMDKVVEDVVTMMTSRVQRKLELVVGIVKSCSPNMLGDLNVTMKDLLGTVPRTIHHKVIGKGGYGKDITVGAAMILTNVSVFSPNPSKHYLNITMRNVVEVFRKDTVLGNGSG